MDVPYSENGELKDLYKSDSDRVDAAPKYSAEFLLDAFGVSVGDGSPLEKSIRLASEFFNGFVQAFYRDRVPREYLIPNFPFADQSEPECNRVLIIRVCDGMRTRHAFRMAHNRVPNAEGIIR